MALGAFELFLLGGEDGCIGTVNTYIRIDGHLFDYVQVLHICIEVNEHWLK